jgi:hypothetical protein
MEASYPFLSMDDKRSDCACARQSSSEPCYAKLAVDFVVSGFQKCGTTTIKAWLAAHPHVAIGSVEDYGFGRAHSEKTVRSWNARLRGLRTASTARTGFKDPNVATFPGAILRLSYVPNVKVIVTVRDPLSMFLSNYAFRQRSLLRDKAKRLVWCPPGSRYARGPFPLPFAAFLDGCDMFSVNLRDLNVRAVLGGGLLRAFPASQLLVTSLLALAANGPAVMARIADFLGVREFTPDEQLRLPTHTNRGDKGEGHGIAKRTRASWCAPENGEVRAAIVCHIVAMQGYDEMRALLNMSVGAAMLGIPLPLVDPCAGLGPFNIRALRAQCQAIAATSVHRART